MRIIIFFSIFIISCTTSPLKKELYSFSVHKDLTYRSNESDPLTLDLYVPISKVQPPFNRIQERPPLVIVIHGGGWRSGSRLDMKNTALRLAQYGYSVANVSYRLTTETENRYPAAIEDLRHALRWLSENDQNYGYDKQKVALWGYSAGAHLAAKLAYTEKTPLESSSPKHELRIKALVAGGTPADFTAWPKSPIVTQFIGKSFQEDPQTWKTASLLQYVSKASPPTFLYHAKNDILVEHEQAEKLAEKLKTHGVKHELHTIRFWGHISAFLFDSESHSKALNFIHAHL